MAASDSLIGEGLAPSPYAELRALLLELGDPDEVYALAMHLLAWGFEELPGSRFQPHANDCIKAGHILLELSKRMGHQRK